MEMLARVRSLPARVRAWFIRKLFEWFGWRVVTRQEWVHLNNAVTELNRYVAASGFLNSTGKHIKKKLRRKMGNINRAVYRDIDGKYPN